MGQPGFFDLSLRYEGLDAKKDKLATLARVIPWEMPAETACGIDRARLAQAGFRARQFCRPQAPGTRCSSSKPWWCRHSTTVPTRRWTISCATGCRSCVSWPRPGDAVPDATTLWLYREALARLGAVEALFAEFDGYLRDHDFMAMGGQIIDATIVAAPRQRNSRDDSDTIRQGQTPQGWDEQPFKLRQKDRDARWTKKHGRTYFGYKNHISMDRRHKLVRRYTVTYAARHDSGELEAVLDTSHMLQGLLPIGRD